MSKAGGDSGFLGAGLVFGLFILFAGGAMQSLESCEEGTSGRRYNTPITTYRTEVRQYTPPPPPLQGIKRGLSEYGFWENSHRVKPDFKVKVEGPRNIMLIWYVVKTYPPKSLDDYEGPYKLNEFIAVKSEGYVLVRTLPKAGNLLDPSQGVPVSRDCPLSLEIERK